jgi:hypothetical protein
VVPVSGKIGIGSKTDSIAELAADEVRPMEK